MPTPAAERLVADLRGFLDPVGAGPDARPAFPGAVVLVRRAGAVAVRAAIGHAVRYADATGTELPAERQVPMATDTIFDVASVSKLFTSIAVMQQVEAGRVDPAAPVAAYLPEFAAGGKDGVTVRHLLTHTSGLTWWLPLWRDWPDPESRIRAALTAEPWCPPGTAFAYSDLNMITLGTLVERVSGTPLDVLVADGITTPLGMVDTGYNPPAEVRDRIAATECLTAPDRGVIRGEVHDENAWSLGGVAGHAGIFSTAEDLAALGAAILGGGAPEGEEGRRILRPESVESMLTDALPDFPADAHGLGFELDQRWYMGALSGPRPAGHAAGHTGFTGTSLVLEPSTGTVAILLSNRVHPSRDWSGTNHARRTVARFAAEDAGLRSALTPPATAWYADGSDGSDAATLTLPVELPGSGARLSFELFGEADDLAETGASGGPLKVESSRDGGTTWECLALTVRGRGRTTAADEDIVAGSNDRHWRQVSADLQGSGERLLRWTWTDRRKHSSGEATSTGGCYVDEVRLAGSDGRLFDGASHTQTFVTRGWRLAHDRGHSR